MTAPLPHRTHYPALDGLRGFASLLVVCYHNYGGINRYLFFGWLGVDIFFVLSGFLITEVLLNSLGQDGFLRRFYMRRVLRLFPVYYAGLILLLWLAPAWKGLPVRLDFFVGHQLWFWTYLQNWLLIFRDPGQQTALNHLWSLAVEEQFYLFWPLAILLLRKPAYLLPFITLVLLLTIGLRLWIWNKQLEGLAYFNLYTFTRIDGICIGCMVALIRRLRPGFLDRQTFSIVLFFALLNFGFYYLNSRQSGYPFLALVGYTTFAMIFGLLVNDLCHTEGSLFSRIFSHPALRFMGLVSYATYFIHWPLYLFVNPYLEPWLSGLTHSSMAPFLSSTLTILASYGLGYLSYRYFELPFLRLKKRFER
jgi:peptidoglycan/LPS O-acetylase OafA/YrhL